MKFRFIFIASFIIMMVGIAGCGCSSDKTLPAADFSKNVELGSNPIDASITIDGAKVGGMSYENAWKVIKEMRANLEDYPITLKMDNQTGYVSWNKIGVTFSEQDDVVGRAVSFGHEPTLIMRYKSKVDVKLDGSNIRSELVINEEVMKDYLTNEYHDIDTPYKNPTITEEGGSFRITEGESGIGINPSVTATKLLSAIKEKGFSKNLIVETESMVVDPDYTADDLKVIKDKLGTYTTSVGGTAARVSNVRLAASRINGMVLMPGKQASVSETILARTEANGYQKAPQYTDNGGTEDGYGGGVCQVSTTLYNALLLAEIKVNERANHSMTVSYAPVSMDAAISENVLDLKFTNNLENPIYIKAVYSGGQLTFTIYGVEYRPSNRKIEYKSEELERKVIDDKITYDPTLPDTYESRTGAKHDAVKAQMRKIVYIDGVVQSDEIIHKDSYEGSGYTIVKGTKKSEEPETETVPETTEEAEP